MPFKRYQIQPVWRADRPQRGRYREFYQCDADVVGSDSLVNEVELVQIFDEALSELHIPAVIRINNRKVLAGIAEYAGVADRMMEMTIAIDKMDKIGQEGVNKELRERGFTDTSIGRINQIFAMKGSNDLQLISLAGALSYSKIGLKGIEELQYIFDYIDKLGLRDTAVELDLTLARGLNYYTGAIFEVVARDVQMGSICGGGRYDDLTGIFGLPGVSGVGISFGADRIYDVMTELNLFPEGTGAITQVMFANFGAAEELYCMRMLREIREAGISAEMYPDNAKLKRQFKYADDKKIPWVALAGADEIAAGKITLKNMVTGGQQQMTVQEMISLITG